MHQKWLHTALLVPDAVTQHRHNIICNSCF